MKKIIFIIFSLIIFTSCYKCKHQLPVTKFTNVVIKNSSKQDSVKVFVTLQYPNSVLGLFGIKDTINKSKGYFYAKKDTIYNSNTNNPLLGAVVSFGGDNLPCQVAVQQGFPNGINIFEFSINTPYEVFDISCEDGVNSIIKSSVSDSNWTTSDGTFISPFYSAENKLSIVDNVNISGVFPYRCTDCTNKGTAVPQNCFNLPTTCNANRTCQVARTKKNGGNIIVEFKQ